MKGIVNKRRSRAMERNEKWMSVSIVFLAGAPALSSFELPFEKTTASRDFVVRTGEHTDAFQSSGPRQFTL